MSQRFIPIYDENGNVIDPTFFEQGMEDFAGEFNGGLDRDNFPAAALTLTELDYSTDAVFTSAHPIVDETSFTPDLNVTGLQGGNSGEIAYLQYTSIQDAHVDVQWGCTWTWSGTWSVHTTGSRATGDMKTTLDTVTFYGTIDGLPLFELGPYEDAMAEDSAYGVGSIQLPAGTHTFRVQCIVQRICVQTMQQTEKSDRTLTIGHRSGILMEFQR